MLKYLIKAFVVLVLLLSVKKHRKGASESPYGFAWSIRLEREPLF
jgi:hypothetical protein